MGACLLPALHSHRSSGSPDTSEARPGPSRESGAAARRGGRAGISAGPSLPAGLPAGAVRAARPRSSLTLREGDDGQGEGEQRQGAEVHAGQAGGRGQSCSARPGGRGALLAAPPPLPL